MKLVNWVRFTWQTDAAGQVPPELPARYTLRVAAASESEEVCRVVQTSFALDSGWSESLRMVSEYLDHRMKEVLKQDPLPCLVLLNGSRIVGASVMDPVADAESHLLSGPLVLAEYRNRGMGSALLQASLQHLQQQKFETVVGMTKKNGTAARYVYPKFGGQGQPCHFVLPTADR